MSYRRGRRERGHTTKSQEQSRVQQASAQKEKSLLTRHLYRTIEHRAAQQPRLYFLFLHTQYTALPYLAWADYM